MHRRVAVLQPLPCQHSQRGWRCGPDDKRHVHHGQVVGQHSQQRCAHAQKQLRPAHTPPGLRCAVAQCAGQLQLPTQATRHIRTLQVGQRGPQQKRNFLAHQYGHETQAPRVLRGGPGWRCIQPGGPGGEQAQQPASRGDQCHQPNGKGNVWHCQQRRQPATQPPQLRAAMQTSRRGVKRPRGQCGGQRGGERTGPHTHTKGAQRLRVVAQRRPGLCVQPRGNGAPQAPHQRHSQR